MTRGLDASQQPAWYESQRFRVAAIVFLGVILIISATQGIFQRDNDFLVHYTRGREALHGHLDLSGNAYLIGRHLLNALISIPPYRLSRAIVYTLALAALIVLLRRWNRLADAYWPVTAARRFAATVLSLLVFLNYLMRDMDDCGLQVILLFMLTSAAWAMVRGNSWRVGFWLAAAASYKTPAALFFPFLLYKRRWREAAHMLAFMTFFNLLLPAAALGTAETRRGWSQFLTMSEGVLTTGDPTLNFIEPPKHQNQSLKFSLARLVEHFPPEHPLTVPVAADMARHDAIQTLYYNWLLDHLSRGDAAGPPPTAQPPIRTSPFFIQVLSLSPRRANLVASAALLALAVALAWRFRRPWAAPSRDADLLAEWSTTMALTALLSPQCWMHHLVLVLPAMLLVMRAQLGRPQPRWRRGILTYVTITMVLMVYDLLTRHGWLLVIANGLHTWACMGLLLLVLTLRSGATGETDGQLPLDIDLNSATRRVPASAP